MSHVIREFEDADLEAVVAFSLDVWVAVVHGHPVGFVAVGLIDEDATRAGEIHMIAVDPSHQGTGVAASLMDRAIAHIKAQGVDLAVIGTDGDPGHAPARGLYEKLRLQPAPPRPLLPDAVIASRP